MPNKKRSKKVNILFVPSGQIVNGNQLSPDNTLLRCKLGLKLWKSGKYQFLAVTGGMFEKGQQEPADELMKQWFVEKGVPAEKIITEFDSRDNGSRDSYENISELAKALRKAGLGGPDNWRITVITQWQHSWRFWISFPAMLGITVSRYPMDYPLSWKAWLMEFAMMAYHLYDRRGVGIVARMNRRSRSLAAGQPDRQP